MSDKFILALVLGYGLGAATFPFVLAFAQGILKRLGRLFSRRRHSRRYNY